MTAPSADVADRLVRTLVEERLAACGNILPALTSIYRWQGAIHTETEVLIVLKTATGNVPALLARAPELHPYEVPELLVIDVETGHVPYLEWVLQCSAAEAP